MLTLRVEGNPSMTVKGVAHDMIELADRMGVMVVCEVNGVDLMATRGMELESLQRQYERGLAAGKE